MEDFRKISGLSCNLDKTFIMRIGNTSGDILENILGLGFNFVDKVKILGFEVSNTQRWDKNNIQDAVKKVQKLICFLVKVQAVADWQNNNIQNAAYATDKLLIHNCYANQQ